MKITSLLGTLALSLGLLASPAAAEKFVVGFQPYDTISYQAIVNAELGLWKKYTPAGTEIEFQPALQGTVVANNMLANKAQVGYMSVMPATILGAVPTCRCPAVSCLNPRCFTLGTKRCGKCL